MSTLTKQEMIKLIEQDVKTLKKMYSEQLKQHIALEQGFITQVQDVLTQSNISIDPSTNKIDFAALKKVSEKIDEKSRDTVKAIINSNKQFIKDFNKKSEEFGFNKKDRNSMISSIWSDIDINITFSIGKDGKDYWSSRLSNLEIRTNNSKQEKLSKSDLAEIQRIGKSLLKDYATYDKSNFVEQAAKTEYFISLFLDTREKVENLRSFKSTDQKWLDKNPREEALVNGLISAFDNRLMKEALSKVSSMNQNSLNSIKSFYSSDVDNDAFKRAKLALKGVKNSLDYFLKELSSDDDYDLTKMYLSDARDHLFLAQACYQNNYALMDSSSRMDTASRELIDDKLWNFLRSDEFDLAMIKEKKNKRKF